MSAAESPSIAMPRLSIIIATWQAQPYLQRCLESTIEQAFSGWELLVADGASTDGTVDLIRRFEQHITWWKSSKDDGIFDAWNQALAHARGEYVAFLGADDAWHAASTLEEVFTAIGNRKFDLVTGRGALVDQKKKPYFEYGGGWDYDKITRRMTICHPGCLHRRELFSRFGCFDASYRISADYEFLLRLPKCLESLHIDIPLVDVEDAGISRQRRWLMLRERYRAQANCPRIGHVRAAFNFADKLWRIPVARALGIPN